MRRLALTFAVASLVPILVLGWLVSSATRHSIEARSTQLYGSTTAALVQVGASALFRPQDLVPGNVMSPDRIAVIDQFLVNVNVDPRFEHLLVVAPDGRVVYSNYPGALRRLPIEGAVAEALGGTTVTVIVPGKESLTYPGRSNRMVEAAVPLRFSGLGTRPVGVVVTSAVDPVFIRHLDDDVARLQRLLAVGLAGLWLVLLPIMFSVSRRLRRQAQANDHLARHDTLTGLPNRNRLDDRLQVAIEESRRSGERVALLLLDLDRFKEVNDTLGHRAGDELLRHVAARLGEVVGPDDLVARLGGDEFAVLVTGACGYDALVEVMERLSDALLVPLAIDGVDLTVEASIGAAVFPTDADSTQALLQHADIAMYAAKGSGGRHAFYDADLDVNTLSRLGVAAELRRALAAADGQVVVHYQPVATAAGQVVAMEALVRWHHPARGLLQPDDFVPLAEQSGLIHRLTRYVLAAAVNQATSWHERGLDVAVAVNLSGRDLRDSTIIDEVRGVLGRSGLPPALLQLEVTETAVLSSPERAVQMVAQVRAMGVGLALDDFGTGYSSLTNLKRLRPDRLKIDRGFVSAMANDPVDAAIVRSVVHLARDLGIGVTAEGVETADQWELLEALGCDLLQGNLLSPPMSGDEATAWLGAREATTAP
ncbi:MAG: putative Diguanylate cyclase/phosphodiesterase [Actinomycetia bacterium]|nr:putative Diguanylate cyclase/phosphodiesterase [Actinomycetes bacterium]